MNRKLSVIFLVLICIFILITGCGKTVKPAAAQAETVTETAEPTADEADKEKATASAKPTEAPTVTQETVKEEKATATASAKPTEVAKATATAKATQAPTATEKPKATEKAKTTQTPKATEAPKATEKTQTGHWEQVWVEDEPAWDEELYEGRDVTFCTACGADITNNIDAHILAHADRGESAGWTIKWVSTIVGYKHHPAEGHYENVWVND